MCSLECWKVIMVQCVKWYTTRQYIRTFVIFNIHKWPTRDLCLRGPQFWNILNPWPTFSSYLYNRVWSELTCCNWLSHSRLACSRLSAHIEPTVNNPRRQTRPILRLVAWHSGRTSVSGRRTFPVLRLTCSWWVTTNVGKPSATSQPTRPTQPFILSGSINE